MKKQMGFGTILAYVNIGLNMLVSVFFTPFILRCLGSSEYGVYRIISSFSGQLGIMSFGISTLITRYIVLYNTKNQKEEKENFLFMAYVITGALVALVIVIGMGMFLSIDALYKKTLTNDELEIAKKLFIIFVANIGFSIVFDAMLGIVRAHEQFIISYSISTVKLILRVLLIVALLTMGYKSIAVVMVDAVLSFLACVFAIGYSCLALKEKPRFHYWNMDLLKKCFFFSLAVFIQAIINQVNRNVDNVILGAMKGATVVTVYSLALTLYNTFISVITIFSGMYGPSATRLVANQANGKELTDFVIKPAKLEAMLAFLIIAGFSLVGRDFISLWLGEGFEDVYIITLILIIPATISVLESITNNLLDAKLKRMPLSIILVCMCAINILISIILINMIGYVGAAFGTAISTILGNGILMSLYLKKALGLEIGRMFRGVFVRPMMAGVLSIVIGYFVTLLPSNLTFFIIKIFIISCIYVAFAYLVGLTRSERENLQGKLKRLVKRKTE